MQTDEQLFATYVATNDKDAITELYGRYRPALLRYLRSYFGDCDSTCEDVLQNTFKRVGLKRADYKPSEGPLKAWIYKIAHNWAIDKMRENKRQKAVSLSGYNPDFDFDPIDDSAVDPEATLIERETLERLRKTDLGPIDRPIVDMRLAGAGYDEIARATGRDKNYIAQRLFRVRKRLRAELN